MPTGPEIGRALIAAWRTNNRVTMYLIENLPPAGIAQGGAVRARDAQWSKRASE